MIESAHLYRRVRAFSVSTTLRSWTDSFCDFKGYSRKMQHIVR